MKYYFFPKQDHYLYDLRPCGIGLCLPQAETTVTKTIDFIQKEDASFDMFVQVLLSHFLIDSTHMWRD